MREALASALDARGLIAGASVLDLFAGSGAVGLELLSRGAKSLVAVDRDTRAIVQNAAALGLTADVEAVKLDLLSARPGFAARIARASAAPFSLVFVDAPYAQLSRVPAVIAALSEALTRDACLVLEHRASDALPAIHGFAVARGYRHGDSGIALLTPIA